MAPRLALLLLMAARAWADPVCRLDSHGSRVWTAPSEQCQSSGSQNCPEFKHFNYVVKIERFVPYMKVKMSWPPDHSEITLTDVWGGAVVGSTAHTLEIEAGTDDDTHGEITLVGTGTLSMTPEIDCIQQDAEPPAPPHILECELDAEYKVEHAYDNGGSARGENAKIHFYKWEDDRSVRLVFHGQPEMQIKHINNAMIEDKKVIGSDTVYYLDLFEQFDAAHPSTHVVSLELSEPTHHPPHVICRQALPPSPPPSPPKPPPPSPPSPPPPPVVIAAMDTCPLGGRVSQGHSRVDINSGEDMMQVIVAPQIWDESYVLIVAVTGTNLQVSRTMNAIFVEKDQRGPTNYLLEFDLLPSVESRPSFSFNVQGHSPELVSLTCRHVMRSPPPPSPPPSPQPPPWSEYLPPAPPLDGMLLASLETPPVMAAGAICVILLLALVCICMRRRSAAQRGFKRELAPTQDDPTGEETLPMPFTGDRKAPVGKAAKWKISVSIGDETFKLSIPTASAASADELKQAVAAACIDKVGDELTPRSWLAGHYATMIIEYLDSQNEAVVLNDDTSFDEVKSTRALHVRQIKALGGDTSDSDSADEEIGRSKGRNVGAGGARQGQPLRAACEME